MKEIILIVITCTLLYEPIETYGQSEKVILFNENWEVVTKSEEASFYRVLFIGADGTPHGKINNFYKTGQLQWQGYFLSKDFTCNSANTCQYDGICIWYNRDGTIQKKESFNGDKDIASSPKVTKPNAPANLEASISFIDQKGNHNNVLDANEEVEIKLTVLNSGKGDAYDISAELNLLTPLNGLNYSKKKPLGNLSTGKSISVSIPVTSSMELESGNAEFEIRLKEGNGFDANPIKISFATQRFKNPLLSIEDHKFTTDEGGKIKLGQLTSLGIVLQNKGQGEAFDVSVIFKNPENVFPANETSFRIDKLKPNESKNLSYEFFTNKKYSGLDIPIEVIITECHKKYGDKKLFKVSLDQTLIQSQQINVNAILERPVQIENVSLTSDVDRNIPINNKANNNRFALVIGNEDYKKFQTGLQSDQNVSFARNDAIVFKEYLTKTIGIPERHVFSLTDATRGQMSRELERVTELVKYEFCSGS